MVWWTGWWLWFAYLIPMFLLFWVFSGLGGRRIHDDRFRDRRAVDWDSPWVPRSGGRKRKRPRNVGPLNYQRPDNRIAEDVSDRLMLDDEIDPSAMEVRVDHGEVILSGSVSNRFEKRLAERIADSVAGVTDVQNHLRIGKGQPPTSPAITPAE